MDYNSPDTIFFQNLKYKKGHMKKEDVIKLNKYISLNEGKSIMNTKDNQIIEEGDIVFHDYMTYIVYQTDNTNAYLYPIVKTSHKLQGNEYDFNFIENNNITYLVSYKNNLVLNKNLDIEIIDKWDISKVLMINQNKRNIKLLKRGINKAR